jgi:hypothetical protein
MSLKKVLALLLIAAIAVSLAACGDSRQPSSGGSSNFIQESIEKNKPADGTPSSSKPIKDDVTAQPPEDVESRDAQSLKEDVPAEPLVKDDNVFLMVKQTIKDGSVIDTVYTYERDDYGRLLGEYHNNSLNVEYGYDEGRQITLMDWAGDDKFEYYEHRFDEFDNLIYYERYKTAPKRWDIYEIEYEELNDDVDYDYYEEESLNRRLNTPAMRKTVRCYTEMGYLSYTNVFEWNEDSYFLSFDTDGLEDDYSLRYALDKNAGKIKVFKTKFNGGEILIEENILDENERLIQHAGGLSKEIHYQYDTNNLCVKKYEKFAEGDGYFTTYTYDEFGNLIESEKYHYPLGVYRTISTTEYEYMAVDSDEFFRNAWNWSGGNFEDWNYADQIVFSDVFADTLTHESPNGSFFRWGWGG